MDDNQLKIRAAHDLMGQAMSLLQEVIGGSNSATGTVLGQSASGVTNPLTGEVVDPFAPAADRAADVDPFAKHKAEAKQRLDDAPPVTAGTPLGEPEVERPPEVDTSLTEFNGLDEKEVPSDPEEKIKWLQQNVPQGSYIPVDGWVQLLKYTDPDRRQRYMTYLPRMLAHRAVSGMDMKRAVEEGIDFTWLTLPGVNKLEKAVQQTESTPPVEALIKETLIPGVNELAGGDSGDKVFSYMCKVNPNRNDCARDLQAIFKELKAAK